MPSTTEIGALELHRCGAQAGEQRRATAEHDRDELDAELVRPGDEPSSDIVAPEVTLPSSLSWLRRIITPAESPADIDGRGEGSSGGARSARQVGGGTGELDQLRDLLVTG